MVPDSASGIPEVHVDTLFSPLFAIKKAGEGIGPDHLHHRPAAL
jgi:nitrogen-specific signal transduction histidine kinase